MASIYSSILAWRIPWREEAGRLQRPGHDWAFFHFTRASCHVWRFYNTGQMSQWAQSTVTSDCGQLWIWLSPAWPGISGREHPALLNHFPSAARASFLEQSWPHLSPRWDTQTARPGPAYPICPPLPTPVLPTHLLHWTTAVPWIRMYFFQNTCSQLFAWTIPADLSKLRASIVSVSRLFLICPVSRPLALAWAAFTKYYRPGSSNNGHLFLTVLGAGKSRIKVLADMRSSEGSLPGLWAVTFSVSSHGRKRESSGPSLFF